MMKNYAIKSNFEKKLKEYYKDNNDIMVYSSDKSPYTSIKSISKKSTILKVYYRVDALRLQIKDNERYKELYYNLLDKGYAKQRETARPESTLGDFQFYVSQTNGMKVISEYVEYIIKLL
jgi:hypothetical protein